jgi:hypothetical protein
VLVLKELFDLFDPHTADAVLYDIRWKVRPRAESRSTPLR